MDEGNISTTKYLNKYTHNSRSWGILLYHSDMINNYLLSIPIKLQIVT